jgi:predicted acetyltransferase
VSLDVRPVSEDRLPDFVRAVGKAFHDDPRPEDVAVWAAVAEPERTLAVFDGDRIVATAGIQTRELTVPGGPVPVAAVTAVGVHADHRRRGLLTELMSRQLHGLHESGGEALAILWASEAPIYGRFGYGVASAAGYLRVSTPRARLRAAPSERPRLLEIDEARAAMAPVYEAVWRERVGMLSRGDAVWGARLADKEHKRAGAGPLRAAVLDGRGYALYAVAHRWADGQANHEVRVRELVALDRDAHAALWRYLLELDLTRELTWELAPADEPLAHMLEDARAVRVPASDGVYARLVDVPRALADRSYTVPFATVLAVEDAFCPWNTGTWRLSFDGERAACEPADRAAADLALGATELGAVHLGGTTLAALAAAGRVRELRAGALAEASVAFRGVREPWTPETF